MPTMRLTDLSVRALKGSDRYITFWDETTPAFGIRVGKRSKTWTVMRGRSRERLTIGRYPDVSVSDARTEAKRLLASPADSRDAPKTFAQSREEFITQNYADSDSRWPHIVRLTFTRVFKELDARQLSDLTDADIQAKLDKVEGQSARLHAYRIVRTFLKWCTRPPRRYLKHSPLEGYEAPGKDRKGTRTLSDDELKAVWRAAEGSRSVFRLLMLWGTRNAETTRIERKWGLQGVLTIPGEHTKNGRDHAIPLLPLAQSVLDARPETGRFYFPGRYSDADCLNPHSLNRMKREIQEETGTSGWQIRDIRRTFRSNMARLGVPRDVCEVLINHAPPVLDEIYDRYDRLTEKRDALAKYEAFMLRLLG